MCEQESVIQCVLESEFNMESGALRKDGTNCAKKSVQYIAIDVISHMSSLFPQLWAPPPSLFSTAFTELLEQKTETDTHTHIERVNKHKRVGSN